MDGLSVKKRTDDAAARTRAGRPERARNVAASFAVFAAAVAIVASVPMAARVGAVLPQTGAIAGAASAAIGRAASAVIGRAGAIFAPRAYPACYIPAGAREQAIKQMRAMNAAGSGAQREWHTISSTGSAITNSSATNPIAAVNAIAIDPSDATDKTIYVGAAAGGVWKTTDGAHWRPLTDNQPSLAIRSLALDAATSPATIFAGTGARTESGESFYGAGVMKSGDGGKTWTTSGSAAFSNAAGGGGVSIEALAVSPNPSAHGILLAGVSASDGAASANADSGGMWRSIDGGATWALALGAPAGGAGFDVKFDPSDSSGQTAYAALGQSSRNAPVHCDSAVRCNGIYMTPDAGASWTRLAGLDQFANGARFGKIALALGAQRGAKTILYAAIADFGSEKLLGIFKSGDGGTTWAALASPPNGLCASECSDAITLAVSPSDPMTIFAGGMKLYRSIDGANSWEDVTTDRTGAALRESQHAIAISHDGAVFYAGNDRGVWSSGDVADPGVASGSHVWNGLVGRSSASSLNISQFIGDAGLEPAATRDENASGAGGANGLPSRVETSFVSDPHDARVSYATFSGFSGIDGDRLGHVFMTASGGAQWRDISANLPNIPANEIVVDPDLAETLYVATDIGVFVTSDQGASWAPLGTGLPLVPVTSLSPQETSRTLTAETWGRGAWMLPIADQNPLPTVTSISPTSVDVGNGEFELTVTGTNFVPSSVINFGDASLTPIGNTSSTSMSAEVPTSAFATASVINVSVTNPSPGGGTSATQPFDVQDYAFGPISPATATVIAGYTAEYQFPMIALNGFDVELTLTCAGLPSDAVCSFAPTDVTPTASGATEEMLVATIPNALAPGSPNPRIPPDSRKIWAPIGGAIAFLLLMVWLAMRTQSRAWRRTFALSASIAGFVLAGTLAGCGRRTAGTPVGTYQVTINVAPTQINGQTTAVIANHQAMVTLIVQQTPP